eukprot:9224192-Pyramimonas_sp.AAC.1
MCEKAGDPRGASLHRQSAKALEVPAPSVEPLQVQLQRADGRARHIESRLEQACAKHESPQAQLDAQQQLVVQLRSERAEANEEHSRLARPLAEKLPEGPSVPKLPAE